MSEILLGMDNAKLGICYIYVCMDGMYASQTSARVPFFSTKNTAFHSFFGYYSINQVLL